MRSRSQDKNQINITMNHFKKTILPILLVGIWINISETIKWELLIKPIWVEHYESLNMIFPAELSNNITWMIWGFLYATVIFILSKKFNLIQTSLLSWFSIFIMMWIIVWNIGILPVKLLWYNVPLSLIETIIAVLICQRLLKKQTVS